MFFSVSGSHQLNTVHDSCYLYEGTNFSMCLRVNFSMNYTVQTDLIISVKADPQWQILRVFSCISSSPTICLSSLIVRRAQSTGFKRTDAPNWKLSYIQHIRFSIHIYKCYCYLSFLSGFSFSSLGSCNFSISHLNRICSLSEVHPLHRKQVDLVQILLLYEGNQF